MVEGDSASIINGSVKPITPQSRDISITEGRVGTISWSGGSPPFSLKSIAPDILIKDKYLFNNNTLIYANNFIVVGNNAASNAIQITDSKNSTFTVPVIIKKSNTFTSYPIAADMGINTTVDFNLSGGSGAIELIDIPVGITATIVNNKLKVKVDSNIQNNLTLIKVKRGLEFIFTRINLMETFNKIDSVQYFANEQTTLDSRLILDDKLSGLLVKFSADINKNRSVRDISISGFSEKQIVQSNVINTKNNMDISYINLDGASNINLFIIKDNVSYDDLDYFYLNIVGRTYFLNIYILINLYLTKVIVEIRKKVLQLTPLILASTI